MRSGGGSLALLLLASSLATAENAHVEIAREPAAIEKDEAPKGLEIRVLARVAGAVVTDRRVLLDYALEHAEEYKPGVKPKLPRDEFDKAFQRVLTQIMVNEDNKIVGLIRISDKDVDESLANLRRTLGAQYKRFLADYDVDESELRPLLAEKVLLRKSLGAKVKAATEAAVATQDGAKEEAPQRAVDEWLRQLRSRYRVQLFKGLTP